MDLTWNARIPRNLSSLSPNAGAADATQALRNTHVASIRPSHVRCANDKVQSAEQSSQHPVREHLNDASNAADSELASNLCSALSEAASLIRKAGVPSWWSDIERLRPNRSSLSDTDAALRVEELDRSFEKYSANLVHRASMTWLIRCFLEIIRRAFHQRSRRDAKQYAKDKVNRDKRHRIGELIIAITKPLYARYGKQAYTLYALLAGNVSRQNRRPRILIFSS